MLFFTQCFGAVLDLIHLRFQHYKAKRVFSAAGQLVCVVNPTHNLKVSCSAWLSIHTARVQVLPPVLSLRARGSPAKAGSLVLGPWWVPGEVASARSRCLGGLALSVTVCFSPDWQQQLK